MTRPPREQSAHAAAAVEWSKRSAVSGLRNHQTYLDVTGNNIANVNTHGYKSTRAVFEDSLSQVVRNAAAPDAANGVGGMNPTQVGLGVRLGQISGNFTQGGLQVTNVPTDMAIQGDGFFMLDRAGEQFYTRNGAFSLDRNGDLVDSQGFYVQGLQGSPSPDGGFTFSDTIASSDVRIRINLDATKWKSWQVAPNGRISGVAAGDPTGAVVGIAQLVITRFTNPSGLERVGGTTFKESLNSGDPIYGLGADPAVGTGLVTAGSLELSNVDLAAEFTNLIMAQRGFQANSKVITASDEVLTDLINMKR